MEAVPDSLQLALLGQQRFFETCRVFQGGLSHVNEDLAETFALCGGDGVAEERELRVKPFCHCTDGGGNK